jgi:hypothetical protein
MEGLIHRVATAKPRRPYAHMAKTRVKTLRKAIFEQPEGRKIFIYDDELIPGFLVKEISFKIRKELRILTRDIPLLDQFDLTTSPAEVNVEELYTQVRSKASTLWLFFRSVISELGGHTTKDEHNGLFALIAALLCHALPPILSNSFQAHIGIQFHSLGGRRRFVEILHSPKVPPSYHSILDYQKQIASFAESSESVSQHDTNSLRDSYCETSS